MDTHAGCLTTETTLCGLATSTNKCGWVFVEKDMKLEKGQMLSLFKSQVSCVGCMKIAQDMRLKEACEVCGQEI